VKERFVKNIINFIVSLCIAQTLVASQEVIRYEYVRPDGVHIEYNKASKNGYRSCRKSPNDTYTGMEINGSSERIIWEAEALFNQFEREYDEQEALKKSIDEKKEKEARAAANSGIGQAAQVGAAAAAGAGAGK
jgi:hypothetical protein